MQVLLESCLSNGLEQFGREPLYPTNKIDLHTLQTALTIAIPGQSCQAKTKIRPSSRALRFVIRNNQIVISNGTESVRAASDSAGAPSRGFRDVGLGGCTQNSPRQGSIGVNERHDAQLTNQQNANNIVLHSFAVFRQTSLSSGG